MKINIKSLAFASFTNGKLDEKKVFRITKYLQKTDLKHYINALKLLEKKQTVIVWISTAPDKLLQKKLSSIFKNKKIAIKEDQELIAGIKIEDFDNVYESNLKNSIKSAVNFITE